MNCANPDCHSKLLYLRGGSLRLLEREDPREGRLTGEPAGFPVLAPRARYFWLCPECTKKIVIRRWTADGLILSSRTADSDGRSHSWMVEARPAVADRSVVHYEKHARQPA